MADTNARIRIVRDLFIGNDLANHSSWSRLQTDVGGAGKGGAWDEGHMAAIEWR
jgi:hypothetical protein